MLIHCPTGLVFKARKWNLGDQETLLADIEDDQRVLSISMLQLASLPNGVVEPGPYPFQKGSTVDWGLVIDTDITAASFQLRIMSDPHMMLALPCQKCGSLPDGDGIHVDLRDVEAYLPTEDGLEIIRSQGTYKMEYSSPEDESLVYTVHLQPVRGNDLPIMTLAINQDQKRMLEVQNCVGIQRIEGGDLQEPIVGLAPIREFYRKQSWSFGELVQEKSEEIFGTVDTEVRFRCSKLGCMTEQEAAIPLDPRFYGLARKKKRVGGQKMSAISGSQKRITLKVSTPSSSDETESPTSTSEG